MKAGPEASANRARILRVLAYYAIGVGVVFLLARTFPEIRQALVGDTLARLAASNPFGDATAPVGEPVARSIREEGLQGAISMLGALAIMVPVTWIYMITRRHRGYDETVVHSLLILPVAVTGIVMIVRYSVALAFSLAGIVAGVRFRTTLEDTKDAVYIFLAIGVGLASGVQELGLALVLSLVFNAIVLMLWATRFGNPYAATAGHGHLALGEALAGPDSSAGRRLVGDPALLDAAAPRDVSEALERAARFERHLAEERGKKKSRRANSLVLLSAREVGPAQAAVEPILEEMSAGWKLAEVLEVRGGGWVLQYLVRIEDVTAGTLVDRLRGAAGAVTGVELRSLKGLKGRA